MDKHEKQSIIETVVMGLVAQGGPSVERADGDTRCLYVGQNGRRCAIGLLLGDTDFPKYCNGKSVQMSAEIQDALKKIGMKLESDKDISFLQSIQQAHDYAATPGDGDGDYVDDDSFFRSFDCHIRNVCKIWDLRFPEELI